MGLRIFRHWTAKGLVVAQLSSVGAHALVKFNEGRDQFFVNAQFSIGYDSNIYASGANESDIVTQTKVGIDYTRKAGLIGVNGNLDWDLGSFDSNSDSDFSNPSIALSFNKGTGRTTGTLALAVARESEADPNVNLRTESWNYDASLNWDYRVIERYRLAGSLGYNFTDYIDNSNGFIDLDTYTASVDLAYAYNSIRELTFGYRIRESETSSGNNTTDHTLSAGLSGKVLAKLNGSIRFGYQIRDDAATGDIYGSPSAEVTLSWAATSKTSVSLSLIKDFSTTATDSSLDSTQLNLNTQHSLTRRFSVSATVGGGESKFFSGADDGRTDHYATFTTGCRFGFNSHFSTGLTYSYLKNWSNRANSDFDRHSVNINLSTNW